MPISSLWSTINTLHLQLKKAEALLFFDDSGKDLHAWVPLGPSAASTQQQLAGTPNM